MMLSGAIINHNAMEVDKSYSYVDWSEPLDSYDARGAATGLGLFFGGLASSIGTFVSAHVYIRKNTPDGTAADGWNLTTTPENLNIWYLISLVCICTCCATIMANPITRVSRLYCSWIFFAFGAGTFLIGGCGVILFAKVRDDAWGSRKNRANVPDPAPPLPENIKLARAREDSYSESSTLNLQETEDGKREEECSICMRKLRDGDKTRTLRCTGTHT